MSFCDLSDEEKQEVRPILCSEIAKLAPDFYKKLTGRGQHGGGAEGPIAVEYVDKTAMITR